MVVNIFITKIELSYIASFLTKYALGICPAFNYSPDNSKTNLKEIK